MRRRMIARLATTTALIALALSPLSAAAEEAPASGPLDAEVRGALLFGALDADGSGVVTDEELTAALERLSPELRAGLVRTLVDPDDRRLAMAEAMIAALDIDGDGRLSAAELAAGMALRAEAREARRAEMQTARDARRAEGAAPRGRDSWQDGRRSERMTWKREQREGWRGRGLERGDALRDRPLRGEGPLQGEGPSGN